MYLIYVFAHVMLFLQVKLRFYTGIISAHLDQLLELNKYHSLRFTKI